MVKMKTVRINIRKKIENPAFDSNLTFASFKESDTQKTSIKKIGGKYCLGIITAIFYLN